MYTTSGCEPRLLPTTAVPPETATDFPKKSLADPPGSFKVANGLSIELSGDAIGLEAADTSGEGIVQAIARSTNVIPSGLILRARPRRLFAVTLDGTNKSDIPASGIHTSLTEFALALSFSSSDDGNTSP